MYLREAVDVWANLVIPIHARVQSCNYEVQGTSQAGNMLWIA
uniref:Uncharacterized protein n=1 Tax=Rhizophora mucronata TaxID=61149 RepID=A0A2P2QBS4_RHIMU